MPTTLQQRVRDYERKFHGGAKNLALRREINYRLAAGAIGTNSTVAKREKSGNKKKFMTQRALRNIRRTRPREDAYTLAARVRKNEQKRAGIDTSKSVLSKKRALSTKQAMEMIEKSKKDKLSEEDRFDYKPLFDKGWGVKEMDVVDTDALKIGMGTGLYTGKKIAEAGVGFHNFCKKYPWVQSCIDKAAKVTGTVAMGATLYNMFT